MVYNLSKRRQMKNMAMIEVKCPNCGGTQIYKHGKTEQGKQRYRCQNRDCTGGTFILEYTNKGYEPGINEQIIKMAANASGIRDTARVLGISKQKVSNVLKKQRQAYNK
jgi:transposase-like protein